MWRTTAIVMLALAIGVFVYRAALVVMPNAEYPGTSAYLNCPEGKVARPVFDLLTGLPGGVVVGCGSPDGIYAVQSGPIETARLGAHWGRAALIGLTGAALAFMLLWWFGRRRSGAGQHRNELLPSA